MSQPRYCTILARNYLPKALALNESLQRHGDGRPLTVLLTDAAPSTPLPDIDGIRWITPFDLGLAESEVLDLAASYDLVEFATAVKPLLLGTLLEQDEHVAYLDPDTYLTSPLEELVPALDAGSGIVLTPHYLLPTPAGELFGEGHLLHVGVYNLGFCAVNRNARDFLSWWWGHLRDECLHDPLAGLFVDQKWVDLGSVLFDATPLRHYGYNVGVANLHERVVESDGEGYRMAGTPDALRLFHFHAFDELRPDQLSVRVNEDTSHLLRENAALARLCGDYAAAVLRARDVLGEQPAYLYSTDSAGRRITRRMRHTYRVAAQAGLRPPSPFDSAAAAEYDRWRRASWRQTGRLMFSDVVKGLRCALPEEYDNAKRRLPGVAARIRGRYVEKSGSWG